MTPSCFDLYFLQTMCPSLNCFVSSFALNLIWLSEATFIFFPQKSELTEFIIIQIVWMHVHIVRVKLQFVCFEFHYQMYRNNIPKCNFFFSNEYKHPNRFVGMFLCINLLFCILSTILDKREEIFEFQNTSCIKTYGADTSKKCNISLFIHRYNQLSWNAVCLPEKILQVC